MASWFVALSLVVAQPATIATVTRMTLVRAAERTVSNALPRLVFEFMERTVYLW